MKAVFCRIGYVDEAIEAERRMRRGEHQHSCATCSKWYWGERKDEHEEEFGHAPEPSGYEGMLVHANGKPKRWRKRPCPDCAEVQRQWQELSARAVRVPRGTRL